jgi:hypothetical protein
MKYLKVFTDFVADMKELGEAERGRLFTAMLEYAETGEEPALRGNERFVWGTAKKNIDNQRDSYDRRCEINRANGSEPKRKQAKASESLQDKDKEKEIKEIDTKVSTKKSSAFHAPTVEEVRAYCQERNNGIDPEAFVNYYENRGWYLSKGIKMRDWKRAVITWEKNGFDKPKKQNPALKYEQKPISKTDFDALVVNFEEEDK